MSKNNFNKFLILLAMVVMVVFFLLGKPVMQDDGFKYEGFAETLAHGKIDFKSYYGFQGLSFFAAPIYLLTHSHISIIITSIIFVILSVPLAYLLGRDYYKDSKAGLYFLALFLLMPYPYVTLMRGFQEAALLFFILLIIYASIKKKTWTPFAWSVGGLVKPFVGVLFPLFIMDFLKSKKFLILLAAVLVAFLYLGVSYHQLHHFINNAAIGSYQGNFDPQNAPSLSKSFTVSFRSFGRVIANLFLSYRKIMISPIVILLGVWSLWFNKSLPQRKAIMFSIFLNFLLVGMLTFSFSKYLLPTTTLFALAAVPMIQKSRLMQVLVLIDSLVVSRAIYTYFGFVFWPNFWVYLLPFYLAIAIFLLDPVFLNKKPAR